MTTRPFLHIAAAFAVGIALAIFLPVPLAVACATGVVFLVLFGVLFRFRIPAYLALMCAVAACGAASYKNACVLPAGHIAAVAPDRPERVALRGHVVDDPVTETSYYHTERKSFTLEATAYRKKDAWIPVRGLVRVDQYFPKARPLAYGDEVTAEGLLYRPAGLHNPGLFDYARYLALKDIYAVLKVKENYVLAVTGRYAANPVVSFAYKVRGRIRGTVDRYLEYPFANFVKAIMIGDRSNLPQSVTDDFMKTGTVHILAISGLNLGIIAAIILAVLGIVRVPRTPNLVLTLIAIAVYTVTAGSSPPVVRAAVIFAVSVIGYLLRRDADMLNSLGIAACAILLWNPRELFDPSFQLSFLSVVSVVTLTPHIEKLFGFTKIPRRGFFARLGHYISTGVAVSIAAWAGTWPVIASYFNIISPVSLAANLVIVPALSVVTALAFAFLGAAAVSGAAAATLGAALQAVTHVTFFVNHVFASMPLAYFRLGAPSPSSVVLYYALLGSLFLPKHLYAGRIAIRRRAVIACILCACAAQAWAAALAPAGRGLTVTFLDVGQGDAALVQTASGASILIDGGTGGGEEKLDTGRSVIAPILWNRGIRRLDAVVVTHFHDDHLGGLLYLLDNFAIGMVVDTGGYIFNSNIYESYLDLLHDRGIRRVKASEGDILRVNEAQFFVLNPAKGKEVFDSNDDSIVMKFVGKNLNVLFLGDVQETGLARLATYGPFLESEIAKVPHHGSSLGEEPAVRDFFELVSPRAAVISVARVNRYNAPSKAVLDALAALGIRTYMTKDSGAVIVTEKGDDITICDYAGKKLAF